MPKKDPRVPKAPRPPKIPKAPKPAKKPAIPTMAPRFTALPAPGVPVLLRLPAPHAATHVRLGTSPGGKARGYTDPAYAAWRTTAALAARQQWEAHGFGPVPAHTPVRLDVVFLSPRPAARPPWCPLADWDGGTALYRPVRPDRENLCEALEDALQPETVGSTLGPYRIHTVVADDACLVHGEQADLLAAVGQEPATLAILRILPSLVPVARMGHHPEEPLGVPLDVFSAFKAFFGVDVLHG